MSWMREEIAGISGVGEFSEKPHGKKNEDILYIAPNEKVFLVVRPKTVEVRCDYKLGQKLREDYETVMESRYFGRGGIEIVPSGQLERAEIDDLIRLSYNLSLSEE